MKVSTGSAMQRLKTAGTFIAGGLVGGLIAKALQHGWSYAVSNGFDPFGDGGKAAYKETVHRIGTATQAGFAVRPLTASAGQGERFTMAAIPIYLIPAVEAATSGGNTAVQGNTIPTNTASSLGEGRPATRKATKVVTAKPRHKPAHSKPVQKTGKGQKSGQGGVMPAKATSNAASGTGTVSNGGWVGKLMPGTPAPAVYYNYNAKPSPQEKAAPAHSWVGKLMTDGDRKVKVNAGKVGIHTRKKSDLHSGAGQTGHSLSGGSGNFPVWSTGKKPIPIGDSVIVCIEDECV